MNIEKTTYSSKRGKPPAVTEQRAHQFTDAECARFLAWFGAATTVPPGDFELAARIRRALSRERS